MPSKERVLGEKQKEYLRYLKEHNRSEITLEEYERVLNQAFNSLKKNDMEFSPRKIGTEEIYFMTHSTFKGRTPYSTRWCICIIGGFLEYCGNPVIQRMKLPWPRCERKSVDWLDPIVAMKLLERSRGIERIIVQLELNQGLRRSEVAKLKVSDLSGFVFVRGKGRGGEKYRKVPYHRDTDRELNWWYEEREERIDGARKPSIVPDNLLLYRKGTLKPYSPKGISVIMEHLSERTGVRFTNHTLRRTFGRTCWQAGILKETIRDLLGHSTVEQTIQYIGINYDDMSTAMQVLGDYQKSL